MTESEIKPEYERKSDKNLTIIIAKTNFKRTMVYAPVAGTINNINLRQGSYVSEAKPILSIIKENSFYVTGYFEETNDNLKILLNCHQHLNKKGILLIDFFNAQKVLKILNCINSLWQLFSLFGVSLTWLYVF